MQKGKKVAVIAAASACALGGAAAGISQSAANSSSGSSKATKPGRWARAAGAPGFGAGMHGGPGGGEVHAVEVVLNKAGTAYITVTRDNGTITEVDASAGRITLKEGTSSVTYGTPAISIPSGATVLLDGASSSLGKLKAGDHVSISSSSEGTTVFAVDSSFKPARMGAGGPPNGGPPGGGPRNAPQGAPQPPGESH